MIKIKGHVQLKEESEIHYEEIIGQIARDAAYGTYQEFPESLAKKLIDFRDYVKVENAEPLEGQTNIFSFEISISQKIFPIDEGGIQHFISTAAGDLFEGDTPDKDIVKIEVDSIDWETMKSGASDNIKRIRSKFNLNGFEPLMAFTFKPRFGLEIDEFIKISKQVLDTGFHIVEPDTRKILQNSEKAKFIEFAKNVCNLTVGNHTKAFSLNLSNRNNDIDEIVRELSEENSSPVVFKIDGGLDGLTLMQKAKSVNPNCIITCYPLLKNQFKSKIPTEFLNEATIYCGADIMYPSGRANIHDTVRSYGSTDRHAVNNSARRYTKYIDSGSFIPTVAGGITPAQLHIFYELYGPNIAFFLGGAVALHQDGPEHGARLCMNIIRHAVKYRQQHPTGEANDIPETLMNEIHGKYENMEYLSPSEFFKINSHINGYFRKA